MSLIQFTRRRLLLATVLAAGMQTAVIGSMISTNSAILEDGVAVTLKAEPVDPRDLLRGDYVVLGYSFSALGSARVRDPWPTAPGPQRLSLRLKPDPDGIWQVTEAAFSPLVPEPGSAVLSSEPFDYQPQAQRPTALRASYGIERYYVPEGQGKALEAARDSHRILVQVRISSDGTARIASVTAAP